LAEAVNVASPLPDAFWRKASPIPVSDPHYVIVNTPLADDLRLGSDVFEKPETLAALSGNARWADVEPVALAYSGHQFGHWNPLMGDGRAHLIATLAGGWELHLKGSGATPFSKNGDGRAALGPMLREYIVSEAFAGLGIPTTRCLAVVATGEDVYRRRKEPGGIVARVAKSHVRVGTFQYAAAHAGQAGVAALVAHMIERSHPDVSNARGLLASVITRQALLIAQWMCAGFIHGVMNTDNMAISGETIDFGPCAFMDVFHPKKVFSSIDQYGRYAWDQQPGIGLWNLTRFAESLLDVLHEDRDAAVEIAKSELAKFDPQFEEAFETRMLAKLGIRSRSAEDSVFVADMLRILMDEKLDYTLFFRELRRGVVISEQAEGKWRNRLSSAVLDVALMQASNPIYIARNHQVESALKEAEDGNLVRLHTLLSLLKKPFAEHENMAGFEAPPLPEEEVTQTFCGT
jgi:serine/tyrosine/threonine adenylyltransferase